MHLRLADWPQLVAPCAVGVHRGHDLFVAHGRDAFREKGLLAPKQASWAGNAAAKLAKPSGGLKVREEGYSHFYKSLQAPTKLLFYTLEYLLICCLFIPISSDPICLWLWVHRSSRHRS